MLLHWHSKGRFIESMQDALTLSMSLDALHMPCCIFGKGCNHLDIGGRVKSKEAGWPQNFCICAGGVVQRS